MPARWVWSNSFTAMHKKIGKPSALWSASLTKLFSYIVCLQLPILFRKPSWIINVRVGDKRLDAFQSIIWISRKVRAQIIGRSCVYFTNFIILLMQFTLLGQNNSSLILFLSFAIKRSREIIFSSVDLVWVFLFFFFFCQEVLNQAENKGGDSLSIEPG